MEEVEGSPNVPNDLLSANDRQILLNEVRSRLGEFPVNLRQSILDMLSAIKDPREKMQVLEKTKKYGILSTAKEPVILVPGYVWKKAGPNSKLEKIVLEYSRVCTHKTNKSVFSSMRSETLRTFKYNICKYLTFLASQDYRKLTINGDVVVEFLKDRKYAKSNSPSRGILLSSMRTLYLSIQILSIAMENYQRRNEPNHGVRYQYVDPDAKISGHEKVTQFIKKCEDLEKANKKDQQSDSGTIGVYGPTELNTIIVALYNKATDPYRAAPRALNAILEVLLGEHLFLKNSEKRNLTLRDLQFTKRSGCEPSLLNFRLLNYRFVFNQIATRHKIPELCLVGAIAMNLWYKFDFPNAPCSGHLLPQFEDLSYFKNRLQFSFTPPLSKSISPSHQCQLLKDALSIIGRDSESKSFLSRQNEARLDARDMLNAARTQAEFDRSRSLTPSNPYHFIITKAGFHEGETYNIPRENIIPSLSLQKKIFPWLERSRQQFEEAELDYSSDDSDSLYGDDVDDDEFTPLFFDMLNDFRPIILQDLVYLSSLAHDSIFAHAQINMDPEFIEFKRRFDELDMQPLTTRTNRESEHAINDIVPNAVSLIQAAYDQVNLTSEHIKSSINELGQSVVAKVSEVDEAIRIERDTLRHEIRVMRQEMNSMRQEMRILRQKTSSFETRIEQRDSSFFGPSRYLYQPVPSSSNTLSRDLNYLQALEERYQEPSDSSESDEDLGTRRKRRRKERPPYSQCSMKNDIESICDIVEEWYHSTDRISSVIEKERRYGNNWRRENSTRHAYFKRRRIIQWITKIGEKTDNRLTRNQIANLLEYYKVDANLSLAQFYIVKETDVPQLIDDVIDLSNKSDIEELLERRRLNYQEFAPYESSF